MVISVIGLKDGELSKEEDAVLIETIKNLLIKNDYFCDFLLTGDNLFSDSCYNFIKTLGKTYLTVRQILVKKTKPQNHIPLLTLNFKYDKIYYPPLDYVPEEYLEEKRNEWMLDNADFVILYNDNKHSYISKNIEKMIKLKIPYVNIAR